METFNADIWENKIYGQGQHLNRYPFDNIVSFIYRNYPRDKARADIKILEIGCGAGNNCWFVAREGFEVTGIDGSSSAIDFAKERFKAEGLNGNFIVGDFTSLPFDSNEFDIVFDRGSIVCCNLQGGKKAISEANRVLKTSGLFFFNPYSQAHSSFSSGKLQPDGYVTGITGGSLTGVGDLCFYSYGDVIHALGNGWTIKKVVHKENRDITGAEQTVHAEWEVIASKK